ncbi:unnamed protein product [Thelazia callipaeda]|uniref:RRM domain-containing protein n=1 Tax=Thelazia callipaeda TaxID=103827 RepID=A0A0N5CYG3_THECL|nr:unnamed protein product [Thelazia callipaeda]
MSAEADRVNGGDRENLQQHFITEKTENNSLPKIVSEVAKPVVSEDTECIPEVTAANNQPAGTPCSGPVSGRCQKMKKKQNQKTFSLVDIFNMHERIGSWADAAVADVPPSYSQEETLSVAQVSNLAQPENCNQDPLTHVCPPSSERSLDRATHSGNVDLVHFSEVPLFEIKVANINYKCSDKDLCTLLGGRNNIVNIRFEGHPSKRGTAIISFASESAAEDALNLHGKVFLGRSLKISRYFYSSRQPYGDVNQVVGREHSKNNYHYEGNYNTLPPVRRAPPSLSSFSASNHAKRFPIQQQFAHRDYRRYDYDNRSMRYSKPGNNQFYPRYANRSFDSYGMLSRVPPVHLNTLTQQGARVEYDNGVRGLERIRTESVRSSTTEGTERHERPRLRLQPRTKPLNSKEEDLPARPTSIFGLAKPVDTSEKEKQAEERLRLEDEAFKATAQRLRKNSEQSVPLSTSSTSLLKNISISSETPPLDDLEKCPPIQENVIEVCPELVRSSDETVTCLVHPQVVANEKRSVEEIEKSLSAATIPPPPPSPSSISSPKPLYSTTSFRSSNQTEASEVLTSYAPGRSKNSYNRTFTRSRDSFRVQKKGKGNASAGGLSSMDKRLAVRKDSKNESIVEFSKHNGPEEPEKRCQQQMLIEQKYDDVITATETSSTAMRRQYSDQQPYSKKEKKKQAVETKTKDLSRYVEAKPFSFSSENKYAALLEADE